MKKDLQEILISEEKVLARVAEMGAQISEDYKRKDFVTVTILKGSFIFTADLLRKIEQNVSINFMVVSSYGSSTISSGDIKIVKDVDIDLKGKDVLIIEDIVDSGRTLSKIKSIFLSRGAKSVKICSLLDKPSRRVVDMKIDYLGFEIPDYFVVGYGLDYNEKYRNLPFVGVLKPEVYSN